MRKITGVIRDYANAPKIRIAYKILYEEGTVSGFNFRSSWVGDKKGTIVIFRCVIPVVLVQ